MQPLHLSYWGSFKSYFKFKQWCFQSQLLVGCYWGAHGAPLNSVFLEIPAAAQWFFFTDPFSGSILLWLSRPLSLIMQIYCLFIASGIHHEWPYVMGSEIMCHEYLPAQPLRQRPQVWVRSETHLGSFVCLPNKSWMPTGNNSSCKPGQSTLAWSWWSVCVYPMGKNHVLHTHLVIKQNTW